MLIIAELQAEGRDATVSVKDSDEETAVWHACAASDAVTVIV